MTNLCQITNCSQPKHALYDGKPYCKEHYRVQILSDLNTEFLQWTSPNPSKRFIYLLGRTYEDFGLSGESSYLSLARIRDRGFNFQKTDAGCQFSITRHLNAWSEKKEMSRLVEIWSFSIGDLRFVLAESRGWLKGDPV